MYIQNFEPFEGQHCETTATGNLLKHLGIHLSEPMLYGLGRGLGFLYWDMPRLMSFPFLGGRIKQDEITANLCQALKLNLEVKETSSKVTAWRNVTEKIEQGIPVGLKLDCYFLDYFTQKTHFAAHVVALYGYDHTDAFLVDTRQQGSRVKTTLESLAQARDAKGPMSSRNLSYTITGNIPNPELSELIPPAIKANAESFLNPPIKNIGYKGIEKASQMIKTWFKRSQDASEYELTATLMESGGAGGALFRNIYRDFLKECLEYVPGPVISAGYERYCQIAPIWNEISSLIEAAGRTLEQRYLDEASKRLLEISKREKEAMEGLQRISAPGTAKTGSARIKGTVRKAAF